MIRHLALAAMLYGAAPGEAWGQYRGRSELAIGALGYLSGPPHVGPAVGVGLSLMEELTVGVTATAGWRNENMRAGGDLLARLRLGNQRRKFHWYLAAGLGAGTGRSSTAFLAAAVGLEGGRQRPDRARQGYWYAELGAAAGFRVATGYRWVFRRRR